MTLTKNGIVTKVQESGFTNKTAVGAVDSFLEVIKQTLEGEEDILVSGFGKFCVKEKAPRRGRNPATGTEMKLWGRRVVTFRCSSKLRDRINGR